MKNKIIKYGIKHPKKGLVGFLKSEIIFPNEINPKDIDVEKTKIYDERAYAVARIDESSTLKSMDCKVEPITVTYTI